MSGDFVPIGRFALGIALIGGLCLWRRRAETERGSWSLFPGSSACWVLIGLIAGYTALSACQVLLDEIARMGAAFLGGWCGLRAGVELDRRILSRRSPLLMLAEVGQGGMVAILIFLVAYPSAFLIGPAAGLFSGPALYVLCGMGVAGAPFRAGAAGSSRTKKEKEAWKSPLAAGLAVALISLGIARGNAHPFSILHPFAPAGKAIVVEGWMEQSMWGLVLGGMTGLAIDLLVRDVEERLLLFVIAGGLALGGGLAASLGLSPLLVGLVGGTWLINCTLRRMEVLESVRPTRRAVEGGLALSAGWLVGKELAKGGVHGWIFLWVVLLFLLLEPVGNRCGSWLVHRLAKRGMLDRIGDPGAGTGSLDDLVLAAALGLAVSLEEGVGTAALAGVVAGQWGRRLLAGWKARSREKGRSGGAPGERTLRPEPRTRGQPSRL